MRRSGEGPSEPEYQNIKRDGKGNATEELDVEIQINLNLNVSSHIGK